MRPFEFPRLRTESHGCATRSAQTVLAERSDSVLRRGRTQSRWEEINQKKIREILREFLIQSKGQAFGGAAGFEELIEFDGIRVVAAVFECRRKRWWQPISRWGSSLDLLWYLEGNHLPSVFSVNLEILVQRKEGTLCVLLGHPDQTRVGERHGNILIPRHQFRH